MNNSKIYFGINLLDKDKRKISVNLNELINPHILIIGQSGSGKTYVLKKLMDTIIEKQSVQRIYCIDGQGDLATYNSSTAIFMESENIGINPLKLSNDKMFGGVRKKIQQFINAINKTSRQLGNRQEAVLRKLLEDLYQANGFFIENPNTWGLNPNGHFRKKYPNAQDLLRFTYAKIINNKFGLSRESIKYFTEVERFNKKKSRLIREKIRLEHQKKDSAYIEEAIKEIDNSIEELNKTIIEIFEKGVRKDNGGGIKDIIKYENVETLKSVYDVLENLFNAGFFKSKEPKFNYEKKIWRYDIQSLNMDEQKLFAEFISQDLFIKAKETGLKNVVYEYLVVDEARKFTDLKKNKDDGLKLISREARKYGLGQILATQQIEHIPNDIIKNSGIKLILGVDETDVDIVSKKLNIKKEYLLKIKPQKTALISIKKKNDNSNFYYPILINIE